MGRLTVAERRASGRSELSWSFAAALFGVVLLSVVGMVGLGFALAWLAEQVA